MTITRDDIKLLASERLNDDADGGGYMTGNVIQDGVENNLFPDISEVDRAQGAVDFRKAYVAVFEIGTDTYYGAHVIIDTLPEDPSVSALLYQSSGTAQLRSEVITLMNSGATGDTAESGGPGWKGTKPLTIDADVDDRQVKIDGVSIRLIPVSSVPNSVSGSIAASSDSSTTGVALVAIGSSLAVELAPGGTGYVRFTGGAMPGTVSGNYTYASGTVVLGETTVDGLPYLTFSGEIDNVTFLSANGALSYGATDMPGNGDYRKDTSGITAATAVSATYQPALNLTLPQNLHEFTFTVGMTLVQTITLPYQSEVASEEISWTDTGGNTRVMSNMGPTSFLKPYTGSDSNATINRSTKQVTILWAPVDKPKVGTPVSIRYVRAGYVQPLGSGCLSGAFSANAVTVTPTSGWGLRGAQFKIGSDLHRIIDNVIYKSNNNRFSSPVVVGAFDPTTSKILMIVADGTTITNWFGVEVSNTFPATAIADAQLPTDIQPETLTIGGTKTAGGTFTATADINGEFSTAVVTGSYSKLTGLLSLTFSESVSIETLTYEGDQLTFTPVSEDVAGVDPDLFPLNGEVQAYRVNDLIVVHNTEAMSPATVTNGQTVDTGRDRVADIRVFGDDGDEITVGFSFSRALGTITFTDVSTYDQPVTITHRVEDMALAIAVDTTGLITLSRPLTHDYPADDSFVSGVLYLADIQARSHPGFQQETWTGEWSNVIIGDGILADYNEVSNPVIVTNKGAITERWAVIFTNTTAYKIIGEQVGQIAIGSTGVDSSPINPATGEPYFTIDADGWGSGWQIGNVYRFNTDGGSTPFWTMRSIAPSDPFDSQDHITVAARGSINA